MINSKGAQMKTKCDKFELGLLLGYLLILACVFTTIYTAATWAGSRDGQCGHIQLDTDRYPIENVVKIIATNGEAVSAGSGFLLKSGVVVTAGHVVNDCNSISVYYSDGTIEISTQYTMYEGVDVATVNVQRIGKKMEFASNLHVGDKIIVAGFPYCIPKIRVCEGTIASEEMEWSGYWNWVYMIDCTVSPGNSGSPVLTSNGEIAGIVVGGGNMIFLCLPAKLVEETICHEN